MKKKLANVRSTRAAPLGPTACCPLCWRSSAVASVRRAVYAVENDRPARSTTARVWTAGTRRTTSTSRARLRPEGWRRAGSSSTRSNSVAVRAAAFACATSWWRLLLLGVRQSRPGCFLHPRVVREERRLGPVFFMLVSGRPTSAHCYTKASPRSALGRSWGCARRAVGGGAARGPGGVTRARTALLPALRSKAWDEYRRGARGARVSLAAAGGAGLALLFITGGSSDPLKFLTCRRALVQVSDVAVVASGRRGARSVVARLRTRRWSVAEFSSCCSGWGLNGLGVLALRASSRCGACTAAVDEHEIRASVPRTPRALSRFHTAVSSCARRGRVGRAGGSGRCHASLSCRSLRARLLSF